MEEFLNKLVSAADDGDIEKCMRLAYVPLYLRFNISFDKEITNSCCFPGLNPDFGEYFDCTGPRTEAEKEAIRIWYTEPKPEMPKDYDYKKLKYELKKEAISRINDNPALLVLASCDRDAVAEITTELEYITLFETALLIGDRLTGNPKEILTSCPDLFLDAVIRNRIDPREPRSLIPYSKLYKKLKPIGNEVFLEKEIPDLSWKLTLKEAAEFAISIGYDEALFADLLTVPDMETTESQSPPTKPAMNPKSSVTEQVNSNSINEDNLDGRERQTLLKIIAALCEKNGVTADQKGLSKELQILTQRLGIDVSEKTISRHLKSASELTKQ